MGNAEQEQREHSELGSLAPIYDTESQRTSFMPGCAQLGTVCLSSSQAPYLTGMLSMLHKDIYIACSICSLLYSVLEAK